MTVEKVMKFFLGKVIDMKIGVISDTHGYEKRFAQACEKFFDGADLILHAGDVLNHGPNNPNCKGEQNQHFKNSRHYLQRKLRFGSRSNGH